MSTYVNMNVVYEDEKGKLFFNKTEGKKVIGHISPEDLGYAKSIKKTIYIAKKISNDESLTGDGNYSFYSRNRIFPCQVSQKYATAFLFQTRSKRVFLKWFDSGCTSPGRRKR